MGDGYQKDQQSLFCKDLDRNLAVMWATEPFRTYRNYINVYAVEIASIDYGVRCDPDGRMRHAGRHDPRHRRARRADQHQEHRAADDLRPRPAAAAPTRSRAASSTAARRSAATGRARPYYPAGVNPCETGNQAHNRILDNYVAPVLGIPRTSQNVQTLAIFNTLHLRRHRRHAGDHLGRLAAGPADLAARDRPLARHDGRRVPVLRARRGAPVLHAASEPQHASTTRS